MRPGPGFTPRTPALRWIPLLLLAGLLALAGCASDGTPAASDARLPAVSAPPPDSPLAKVELGMDDDRVEEILGRPGRQISYPTFKAWIPFYQAGDEKRYEWLYPGTGRVTFNNNPYSGELQVIRVDYEPGSSG